MSRQKNSSDLNRKTAGRVLQMLKGYRTLTVLSLIFAAISSVLLLAIPLLTGYAIDFMLGKDAVQWDGIIKTVVLIAVFTVISAAAQWLMNILNNRITYGTVYRLRKMAFEKLQVLPISYIDSHPIGDTVSRMMTDVDQFTDGLLMGFQQFFTGMITVIGTLVIMLAVKPSIALVVILITPLSLFAASFIAKKTFSMFRLQAQTRAEQTSLIDEYIGNHKTVAAFGQEDEAEEQFDEVNKRLTSCSLKATFYSSITNPSTRFVNNLVYAGVAVVGALLCIPVGGAASFTVGKLVSFLSYANQYTKPFNEISGVFAELQNALACAGRVFELLDEHPISPDSPDAKVLTDPDGRVSFDEVSFAYSKDKPLIKNMNLNVRQGQHIAIVGPTGCGKTTLINLLMRFYDVDCGSVSVSGTDVRDLTRHSLRSGWGMVLQDTVLFSGTVRENLCMAKPDATDEEMIAAAKAAHCHTFIKRLPKGYDTYLSEGGGSLSQGQKQLLCIARLMICPPPMLILDEATSSIDTRMELKIQNAFSKLMEGRTSFVVAHRLSTIESADSILVMKDGNIIEQGNHRELLQKKGFYYQMYHSQFEK